MSDRVTLVFTRNFSPYNKGDVATFDKEVAEALKNPTYVDEKGRVKKIEDGSPVEEYSASKHKDTLIKMRGKDGDKAVEVGDVTTPGYYSATELEAVVARRLELERRRTLENGTPLSVDTSKPAVNREQQAAGTVVTDPTEGAVAADGGDPQAINAAQHEVSAQVKKDKK